MVNNWVNFEDGVEIFDVIVDTDQKSTWECCWNGWCWDWWYGIWKKNE